MGILRQKYRSSLPFPFPVGHILSELSTMTHPSWVALHDMAHSSIELDGLWSMWSDWLVFCDCGFQSICPLMKKDKRLVEASWRERLTEGETGFCYDGQGHAQFSSVIQSYLTLCDHRTAACQASLSITNSQNLLKLMSIASVMPSNHLILCCPLLLLLWIFPSIRQGLFQWVSSLHQMGKVLEFQLQHQSFQWIFRTDFLKDGLVGSPCSQSKGLSRVFSNTTVQKHQFFGAELSL